MDHCGHGIPIISSLANRGHCCSVVNVMPPRLQCCRIHMEHIQLTKREKICQNKWIQPPEEMSLATDKLLQRTSFKLLYQILCWNCSKNREYSKAPTNVRPNISTVAIRARCNTIQCSPGNRPRTANLMEGYKMFPFSVCACMNASLCVCVCDCVFRLARKSAKT